MPSPHYCRRPGWMWTLAGRRGRAAPRGGRGASSRPGARIRSIPAALLLASLIVLPGCRTLPVSGAIRTDARVAGTFRSDNRVAGTLDVRLPPVTDPGPVVPVVVRSAPGGSRVALLDVDGLLLNQNLTGLYSVGENPVSALREKLEAAAADPLVRAVVLRINSPGGGVTASDIMAEELRRFRAATGKPVVSCLMDLATGGAYYLAVGADRIVAHPTAITGGVGALINHYNLEDAMAQFNLRYDPIKAGELVDMGSVTAPLGDQERQLLEEMVGGFRDRFAARVARRRPAMTSRDRAEIQDGRVVPAPRALRLHMVDRLGYIDDAIAEAEQLAGIGAGEVVLFQRAGYPVHSIYSIVPNTPIQNDVIPFSYPGLDRNKMPTFLYLWQPEPTLTRLGGR